MAIPLARPTMRRRYMHSVLTQLVGEELGPGKVTRELVTAVVARFGLAGGVALSSTYTAIAAATEVLELAAGDRVLVPAFAPVVYMDALSACGLVPRLLDVDADGRSYSREMMAAEVEAGVKAMVAYSAPGLPMEGDLVPAAGVPVMEDVSGACPASSGEDGGLMAASPALTLLSLDGGGPVSAGCGALLLAGRKGLVTVLKSAAGNASSHQQLPNMNAALALAQLDDLQRDSGRRREIALLYRSALQKSRHEPLGGADVDLGAASCFPVRLKDSLPEARQYARKHGVETRACFEDTCAERVAGSVAYCPNARRLLLCCLAFPLYPMLSRKEVESICRVLATLP